MKRLIFQALLVLLAFFTAIIFSEVLLRVFWNPPYLDPKYQRNDLKWISENVSLNRFGYRDREFELKKRDGVFRIYCLGDSYTYGWYINNVEDSWPKQLERVLKERYPDNDIEVINASKPGFNLDMEIKRYKNEGILFNPDLILIGINSQDLAANEFPPKFIKNKFIRSLRIYQVSFGNLERSRAAKKTFDEIKATYKDGSDQLKQAEESLSTLSGLTKNTGAEVGIIVFPEYNPTNPDTEYQFQDYHRQIKDITDRIQLYNIDLYQEFEKITDKKSLVLNPIDPHPSIFANKIAGEAISKLIDFNKLLNKQRAFIDTKKIIINDGLVIPNFQAIVSLEPTGWVYFNEEFGLTDQKIFLPNSSDRIVSYLEDILKTVKSFTHGGWPGAKIEYNIGGKSKNLKIPKRLYGYEVIGISNVAAFWRVNSNLQSQNLDLSELNIYKDDKFIYIDIINNNNVDYYKVTIDIAVKQFDINKGKITNIFATKLLTKIVIATEKKISFSNLSRVGSYSQFSRPDGNVGYVWINNKLDTAKITTDKTNLNIEINSEQMNSYTVEIPVAIGEILEDMPTVEYITKN